MEMVAAFGRDWRRLAVCGRIRSESPSGGSPSVAFAPACEVADVPNLEAVQRRFRHRYDPIAAVFHQIVKLP